MVCSTYQNIMPSLSVKLSLFQQSVGLEGAPQTDNYAALGSKRIRDVQNYICCLPALNCFVTRKPFINKTFSDNYFCKLFQALLQYLQILCQKGNSQ